MEIAREIVCKTLTSINLALNSDHCTLKTWQKLVGRLNDAAQMCPFMKLFRQPINQCLAGIDSAAPDCTPVLITEQAKDDLKVWAGFLSCDLKWLPIGVEYSEPPRVCREFVSDAAGLAHTASISVSPGIGNVGFCEQGTVIFAHQMFWPADFITSLTDEKGVRFGDKTTTLEMIGLLMPLILVPELVAGRHVRFMVDCFGTVYGMHNRAAKGDSCASVFIRAAYLIAAYLECTIHVQHLPRVSDWGAQVTDRLSRGSTSTKQDKMLVRAFNNRQIPSCLKDWFKNPNPDFSLAMELLEHVKRIM